MPSSSRCVVISEHPCTTRLLNHRETSPTRPMAARGHHHSTGSKIHITCEPSFHRCALPWPNDRALQGHLRPSPHPLPRAADRSHLHHEDGAPSVIHPQGAERPPDLCGQRRRDREVATPQRTEEEYPRQPEGLWLPAEGSHCRPPSTSRRFTRPIGRAGIALLSLLPHGQSRCQNAAGETEARRKG